jgi:hypothetical protein
MIYAESSHSHSASRRQGEINVTSGCRICFVQNLLQAPKNVVFTNALPKDRRINGSLLLIIARGNHRETAVQR